MPELSDDIVQNLLPRDFRQVIVPVGVEEAYFERRISEIESPLQREIYRLTTALQAITEERRLDRNQPGFQGATYGFVPVGADVRVPRDFPVIDGYVFGAAVQLPAIKNGPPQIIRVVRSEKLSFPVVLNFSAIEFHVANPSGSIGTGACWARSKKAAIRPSHEGILTAAHIFDGVPLLTQVGMSLPGPWYLGDRGECKIDAAIIVQTDCIPYLTSSLQVENYPIANQTVTFSGVGSGASVQAQIQHSAPNGTHLTQLHPLRLYLDKGGVPGDSGALVRNSSGAGVGIYIGKVPILGTHTYYGVAQLLSQAQYALNVDLYE
jgi:hypothetical protein